MRRIVWSGLAVITIVVLVGLASAEEEQPEATLTVSEWSVAAGIGWTWGTGVLTYQGKDHPFRVEGLSVGQVGVARADATGNVYHLTKLEDFNGTYAAAAAGATVGGGAGATTLKNQNGVVINIVSTTQGVAFKLAAEGMKLTLTE
jgi:hypothetical protein